MKLMLIVISGLLLVAIAGCDSGLDVPGNTGNAIGAVSQEGDDVETLSPLMWSPVERQAIIERFNLSAPIPGDGSIMRFGAAVTRDFGVPEIGASVRDGLQYNGSIRLSRGSK